VTHFDDAIMMTSLVWRQNWFWFCHNQYEETQFGQITQLQITNIES